jgi:thymidylate synthase
MDRVKDIREKFIKKYKDNEFVILTNGVKTIELISQTFIADEDFIFKKPNYSYIAREISWYKSQSLNIYDISGKIPNIWKNIADKDGFINSNYGWCIFSNENGNQYRNCFKQLLNDPSTRRACMIYTRPSMQYDWYKNGMSDFMCTYSTQQFIRNNRLIYCVYMRSNDAIFGYRNDYAWHKTVAAELEKDLKDNGIILEGEPNIIWNAASLHIYESHFDEIKDIEENQQIEEEA